MKTATPHVNVVVRRHRASGDLELFFANAYDFSRHWWVECFNPATGHVQIARRYMQRDCDAVPVDDPQAVALAESWGSYGPDALVPHIVKSLRGPKGYTYGGE